MPREESGSAPEVPDPVRLRVFEISSDFRSQFRLLKPEQFRYVFRDAHRLADRYFTVLVRANAQGHPRIGVAVSRKCAKTAVARNRIKRQIREVFRTKKEILGGYDIVFIAKAGAQEAQNRALAESVERHLTNIARRTC